MRDSNLYQIIASSKVVHFAGIGGVSMSGLAVFAKQAGFKVTGSDQTESATTKMLVSEHDIPVAIGQVAENVHGADIVVYSVALSQDNPELVEARKLGIPVITRGDFLGYVMSHYRLRIGVSGTHGKSTTTAMISHILMEAGKDPTIACGAIIPEIGGTLLIGSRREYIVYEACEYRDSFLSFDPTDAIITNIELDHTDYFHGIEDIIASFKKSIEGAACVYANFDCENSKKAVEGFNGETVSYAIEDKTAQFHADDLRFEHGKGFFTLMHYNKELCKIKLPVIGRFNVYNALCAAAVAYCYMIPINVIKVALENFTGVSRRFEYRGDVNGISVYDDYAHHPDEVRATLAALPPLGYNDIWLVFQPHTYTRTRDLWEDWVDVFTKARESGIHVVLADIYAAREHDNLGVSSSMLAEQTGTLCLHSMSQIASYIRNHAKEGDLVLTMGAGQANIVGNMLLG